MKDNEGSGEDPSLAATDLPALTAQERDAFQRVLTDRERYFSEAEARVERLLLKLDEEVTEEELDDAGENVSFALSHIQWLRELVG